jgi:phage N-6-adenine-methyltransferase
MTDLAVLIHAEHDRDAVEIGQLYFRSKSSLIDGIRYALECGERLKAKKNEVGHGHWIAWINANTDVLGFGVRSADRLMRSTAILDASVQFDEVKAIQISRQIWGHDVRGTFGTGQNEWHTPDEYLDRARKVLGEIDLDPASHQQAQQRVQARKFFTASDDGLAHEWHGRVWLNPPYGTSLIADFVDKLIEEYAAQHVTAAIMLTHSYSDTEWFHAAAEIASAICFTRGRIRFIDLDGDLAAPTQGQAFFYFGNAPTRTRVCRCRIGCGAVLHR